MPGSIQSIERAAAVLHFLGAAPEPVALGELASALGLPKPTAHGIVRTLVGVGFVSQDPSSGRYSVGAALSRLEESLDPHLLRSRASNWADGLAALTGLEVQLGVVSGPSVEVLHHVFRPDGSPQRLRVGELQPLHATALGLVLLAFVPGASRRRDVPLASYTPSTPTQLLELTRLVQLTSRRGWSVADGTYRPGVASLAAPIRHHVGVGVGALAVVGPRERIVSTVGEALPELVDHVVGAAAAISARLEERL